MELLISIIISAIVSSIITEIRCRIYFDAIDKIVMETLQRMREICDECIAKIIDQFKH